MIADGKHEATLFDVNFCVTNAGTPAVSLVWETVGGDRVSYLLTLTDSTGRPNHFVIQLTRRWATAWNGHDLAWFRENREVLLGTRVVLTVRGGAIEWVTKKVGEENRSTVELASGAASPLTSGQETASPFSGQHNEDGDHHSSTSTLAFDSADGNAGRRIRIKLVVDPAKLSEMPERIEPNFEEAKTLFDVLTEGTDKLDADKVWTLLAKKIGPLQIDFGEAEWQQMIDRIRHLKSWEGVVRG